MMKKTELKTEFKGLMDEIIEVVLKEGSKQKNSRAGIPLITKNVMSLLINLNKQIDEIQAAVKKLEDQDAKTEKDVKLLIHELKSGGFISLRERRRLLRRNAATQEALIDLLDKKGIISKRKLIREIKTQKGRKPRSATPV